jgi:putative methylase
VQKRIVRKLDLEILLSKIAPHPHPNVSLEQYVTPPDVAANLLYVAAYVNDSIVGKRVLDLGCGTGRLALGAAFLGAREAVGIDIDVGAVRIAADNAHKACLERNTQWVAADIGIVSGRFDTVIENPPFGVQMKGADMRFLAKALEVGGTVYSLHKDVNHDFTLLRRLRHERNLESTDPGMFLAGFVKKHEARIRNVYVMVMSVPHMFGFHTKMKHEFLVDLYVIETGSNMVGA